MMERRSNQQLACLRARLSTESVISRLNRLVSSSAKRKKFKWRMFCRFLERRSHSLPTPLKAVWLLRRECCSKQISCLQPSWFSFLGYKYERRVHHFGQHDRKRVVKGKRVSVRVY